MSAPHLYIHVPFCARRCSYCDFSIAVRREVPGARFIDAIKAELVTRRISGLGQELRTLYFGGGTPSKLGADVGKLTNMVFDFWRESGGSLAPAMEVTVEANPEDIEPELIRGWVAAGVNRVSLGVQSFDDSVLQWMHRTHDSSRVKYAAEVLAGEGISDWSLDLIYALPDEIRRDWPADLERAIALQPTHLSAYGLTVEPHTPLGRWADRGAATESPEERYGAEFLEAHRRLTGAGFEHYEVSNFGRPGYHAKHNSAYWTGAKYLGLGPSAHGFDGQVRRWNARDFADWMRRVEGGEDPIEGTDPIGLEEAAGERIYLGLRTSGGLKATEDEFRHASRYMDAGWAERVQDRLVLTAEGWLRLDAIAAALTMRPSH